MHGTDTLAAGCHHLESCGVVCSKHKRCQLSAVEAMMSCCMERNDVHVW